MTILRKAAEMFFGPKTWGEFEAPARNLDIFHEDVDLEDTDDDEDDLDAWDSRDEYGYADDFLGDETWEDQKGMETLKANLRLPLDWYLIKVVNFDSHKLQEVMGWLAENCTGQFRRVNWSSGCSTKIGVAFENSTDAIFFKLRWR